MIRQGRAILRSIGTRAGRIACRPWVLAASVLVVAVYLFLQSPSLWFVVLLPSAVPEESHDGERVLVVAPHPDDDILGVGSSIAAFRERGVPVLVVFMTSGDANVAGQWLVTMNPFLFPAEFRAIGARRQKEATVALGRLGVAPESAVFLNYPDRGLAALLDAHWMADAPYRSPYTARSAKYSSVALRPGAPYCGEAVLEDLVAILERFRPTIVYLPHPLDAHEDHRAAHTFVRQAVRVWSSSSDVPGPPSLRSYLVHSYAGLWPTPSSIRDVLPMEPLAAFVGLGTWYSMPLTPELVDAKYRALRAHASQWWTCGSFLSRFVCANELYMVEDS